MKHARLNGSKNLQTRVIINKNELTGLNVGKDE